MNSTQCNIYRVQRRADVEMTYARPLPPNPNSVHCPTNWGLPTKPARGADTKRGDKGLEKQGLCGEGPRDRGLAEKGLEERVSVREGNGDRGLPKKGFEQIRACARTHMLTDSIQRERTLRPDSEQMGLGTSQWVCRFQKQSSYYCTISYVLVETLLMMIMILLCHHCHQLIVI